MLGPSSLVLLSWLFVFESERFVAINSTAGLNLIHQEEECHGRIQIWGIFAHGRRGKHRGRGRKLVRVEVRVQIFGFGEFSS